MKLLSLLQALRDQGQYDEDGVMCVVSRQAIDEAIAFIETTRAQAAPPREWRPGDARCDECDNRVQSDWIVCPYCGNDTASRDAAPQRSTEALEEFAKAIGYPFLPCPICNGVEGCDHTVPERCRAALSAQPEAQGHGARYGESGGGNRE